MLATLNIYLEIFSSYSVSKYFCGATQVLGIPGLCLL